MTSGSQTAKEPATPAARDEVDLGVLSQWQLIRLRFLRHRLAVISLLLLGCLYFVALFAEFFATYPSNWRDLDYVYSPPQTPRFSFEHGLHAQGLEKQVNPVTLQKQYVVNEDRVIPLGFFVEGEPYRLWGLIPWNLHFFGVDLEAYYGLHGRSEKEPRFMLLGADQFGHDVYSQLTHGSRISLSIGLIAISITFLFGLMVGGVSGYFGGALDTFIQRVIEIVNAFPQLPMWLALAAVMPADWSPLTIYFAITIVLSLLNWTGLARVARGKVLSLREEDYALAARLLGASHRRIIGKHLLPGFTSHIIVTLTLSIPGMILGETALSFLDLGLRPPIVSWGVLLQECQNLQNIANYPWLLMPVFYIIMTVLAFNFLGDGLRDAADPYS